MAFDTNGTSAVLTGTVSRANQSFTICTWMKIDVDRNDWSTYFAVDNGSAYMLAQSGSSGVTNELWWNYGGSSFTNTGADNLTVGTWYFVAGVFDATADTWTFYYMQTGGSAMTQDLQGTGLNGTATLNTLRLGEWHSGEPLNGRFRNAKWFDAALTPTELLAEAQNETIQKTGAGGRRWSLVSDANVDEGTGNLTVSGTATWPSDDPDELVGGTDATATPAVIAVTSTLPAPSVTASGSIAVAALSAAVSLPSVTATGVTNATATPSALILTASLPAVSPLAGSSAEPGVLATTVTLPAPSASGSSAGNATPSTMELLASLPGASALVGAAVTPGLIDVAISLPQSDTSAGASVTPDPIAVALEILGVSPSASSAAVAALIEIAPSLPGPTLLVSSTANPEVINPSVLVYGVTALGDGAASRKPLRNSRVATAGYLLRGHR